MRNISCPGQLGGNLVDLEVRRLGEENLKQGRD